MPLSEQEFNAILDRVAQSAPAGLSEEAFNRLLDTEVSKAEDIPMLGGELMSQQDWDNVRAHGKEALPGTMGMMAGLAAAPFTGGSSLLPAIATAVGGAGGKLWQQKAEGRPTDLGEAATEGAVQGGTAYIGGKIGQKVIDLSMPLAKRLMGGALKIDRSYVNKMAKQPGETFDQAKGRLIDRSLRPDMTGGNVMRESGDDAVHGLIDDAANQRAKGIVAAPDVPDAQTPRDLEAALLQERNAAGGIAPQPRQEAVDRILQMARTNPAISHKVEILEPAPTPTPIEARNTMLATRRAVDDRIAGASNAAGEMRAATESRVGRAIDTAPPADAPITRGWPNQPRVDAPVFSGPVYGPPKPPGPVTLAAPPPKGPGLNPAGDQIVIPAPSRAPARQLMARTERQIRPLTPKEIASAIEGENRALQGLYGDSSAAASAESEARKAGVASLRDSLERVAPGTRDAGRQMQELIDLRNVMNLARARGMNNNTISLTDIISLSADRPAVFAASMSQKPVIAAELARRSAQLSRSGDALPMLMRLLGQQASAQSMSTHSGR